MQVNVKKMNQNGLRIGVDFFTLVSYQQNGGPVEILNLIFD